jgi:amino acid permease
MISRLAFILSHGIPTSAMRFSWFWGVETRIKRARAETAVFDLIFIDLSILLVWSWICLRFLPALP